MKTYRRDAEARREERNDFFSAPPRLRGEFSPGFTLVEVMAALAILVLFLVPLLGAVSQGLQFVGRARTRTEALQLAQDKLAEVEMMTIPETEGVESGDFGRDYPGWRWEVEASKPPIIQLMEQQFTGLQAMEIHVTVFYDEAGTPRTVELDGIVMQ